MNDQERIWRREREVQRAKRADKGAVAISWTRTSISDPKGISGSEVNNHEEISLEILQADIIRVWEKGNTDRLENRWNSSIWPQSPTSQRCQERSSPCVRSYTKSLHSVRPFSLSPVILSDPISTGKRGRQWCGVWWPPEPTLQTR